MVLSGATMDTLVKKYGIDNNTTIVFTGGSILHATRAYWTFRYWGFQKDKLKVLDGLNTTWIATYPLLTSTDATLLPTLSTYSVKKNTALRTDLRASLSEMISVASGSVPNAVILDARTASTVTTGSYVATTGVFAGPTADWVVFEGRMKGAQALNFADMYNATTLQFKSAAELTTLFATVGINSTKTTYAHCRTGVIASVPFFVLDAILGWPVQNYDASWSQWGQMSANSGNGGQLSAGSPWITDIASLSDVIVHNHPTKAVELLTLDGIACSGSLSTGGVATYLAECTPTAPESNATSGNQIEEADAAYMVP